MSRVFAKHGRFLAALGLGCAVALAAQFAPVSGVAALLLAVNAFFVSYLALMTLHGRRLDSDALRRHAETEDEGIVVIALLALGTVGISLTGIFSALNGDGGRLEAGLAFAAVPLGWAMVQVVAAFRYAYLYYAMRPVGGLAFPGNGGDPAMTEFAYLAFGIGMTAQVADVDITATSLRRAVLVHAVGSFFYNTVILALAVNAGLSLGGN